MSHQSTVAPPWIVELRSLFGSSELQRTPPAQDEIALRILVIDDDAVDRIALVKTAAATRCVASVESVGHLRAARDRMLQPGIDLILLDHDLPDGVGLSIIEQAMELGISVVLITGVGNERVAVNALNSGASDYLVKDVGGHYLKLIPNTIARILKERQLARERDTLLHRMSEALETIRMLQSFVQVCVHCKNVKVTEQEWQPMDQYFSSKLQARISHGYCPTCYERERNRLLG
ncbi:MAG: response regulator [Candidatus Hydrogenedentes bacterium]|nr:response regulator [Candidatus Hydrogenedentota bacterium]